MNRKTATELGRDIDKKIRTGLPFIFLEQLYGQIKTRDSFKV